jgi:hypothetical protein
MTEQAKRWLWELLRRNGRKQLDRLEAEMIKRPFERRQIAGDPVQKPVFRVRTRNKEGE